MNRTFNYRYIINVSMINRMSWSSFIFGDSCNY